MRPTHPAFTLLILLLIFFTLNSWTAIAQPKPPIPYEVWVTDQANDTIHIFNGRTSKRIAKIAVDNDGQPATSKPHTVSFNPNGQYAYVANVGAKTNTNNVVVIRSNDRKIIATIPAGPGAHMVLSSPDGSRAFVANAGGDTIIEFLTDTAKGRFTLGRTFKIEGTKNAKSHPTCLAFSSDGKKLYVTNAGNPKMDASTSGFLVVLDVNSGRELTRIPDLGNEACGLARSQDGSRMYFTMGETVNKFAILDTTTDKILKMTATGGKDPHGLSVTPSGHQVWISNRTSGNLSVLSTTTGMHIRTYFKVGDKPDLLDFAPDGSRVFVTLRGHPVTPMPAAAMGTEPGLLVLQVDTGKVLTKVPIKGDPHGIAVRTK
jgi:DNA-binding beta-propeller fold protein YncE